MAVCDICGKEVDKVFTCKECGKHFCKNDGNVELMLCVECMDKKIENQESKDITHDLQEMEQEHFYNIKD